MNQAQIVKEFGVKPTIDVNLEINNRVEFLATYLRGSGQRSYVLGISGGVDSSTAGRLAQISVEKLRAADYQAKFIAVRLPYGVQRDEQDAQDAIAAIGADETITVNIKPAVDATMESLAAAGVFVGKTPAEIDFIKGNVKARERMIVQYAIAGAHKGIVIGTDHAGEALMGFYTKHGDGACDVIPLTGLNKRQVRLLAKSLGMPASLYEKPATADLEDLNPGLLDEDSFGVPYDNVDNYLEGQIIPVEDETKILRQYAITQHKRALPVAPQ
jgi:NAD+ synthase